MLTVKEAIQARRSVRRFRPDPIPGEMIHELLEEITLNPHASASA